MKKILLIVVVLVLAGAALTLKGAKDSSNVVLPWIDIEEGTVSLFDSESGEYIEDAVSGEDVEAPVYLVASDDAQATLYFGDGSEARLDSGAELTLESGEYDSESGTLTAQFYVSAGRVWSKIIELATPESAWEVETATAVATVRGTAFGVKVEDGSATVIGSENEVAWIPVDEETRERLEDDGIIVTKDEVVSVAPEMVRQLREKKAQLIVEKFGVDVVKSAWAADNETRDELINEVRAQAREQAREVKQVLRERVQEKRTQVKEEIRQKVQDRVETRKKEISTEIKDRVQNRVEERKEQLKRAKDVREMKVREKIDERKEEVRENIQEKVQENISDRKEAIETVRENIKERIDELPREEVKERVLDARESLQENIKERVGTEIADKKKVVRLELVKPDFKIRPVEGEEVQLRAKAIFSDGTAEDVTKSANWQVVGPIGSFTQPGLFVPRVADDQRERGKGQGSILVSWTQPITGEVAFTNTDLFEVRVKFDGVIDERG